MTSGGGRRGTTVLIVDDDRDLVELIAYSLRRANLIAELAYDVTTALRTLALVQTDLLIVDADLPGWNTGDLIDTFRRHADVPLIVVSATASEDERVAGLEGGADEFLSKPFSHRELIARIRVQLRHRAQWWQARPIPGTLRVGSIDLNLAERSATRAGQALNLTPTELRLLHALMLSPDAVIPHAVLLRQVWGYEDIEGTDVLRVTIHRLRRKLSGGTRLAPALLTVAGAGIMLRSDA